MTRALAAACLAIAAAAAESGHTTAHGGCLNELGSCENGHAEVKIEGTRLRLWFVGGGTQTTTAVRIAAPSLTLTAPTTGGQAARSIVLAAKPLLLADERVGDCSYFEGDADWLAGATSLTLTGTVVFKGAAIPITIVWPTGYDSDAPGATK